MTIDYEKLKEIGLEESLINKIIQEEKEEQDLDYDNVDYCEGYRDALNHVLYFLRYQEWP